MRYPSEDPMILGDSDDRYPDADEWDGRLEPEDEADAKERLYAD